MKKDVVIFAAALGTVASSALAEAPSSVTVGSWTAPPHTPAECTALLPIEGIRYGSFAELESVLAQAAPSCPQGMAVEVTYEFTEANANRCADGTPGVGQLSMGWGQEQSDVLSFAGLLQLSLIGSVSCTYPDQSTVGMLGVAAVDACDTGDYPVPLAVDTLQNGIAFAPTGDVPVGASSLRISTSECDTLEVVLQNTKLKYNFIGTAPIDEPTEAPIDEPTEAPIDEPTEAPIDEPTEAPIDEPTEAPIGESTEAPIGESTEVPIGESTEAPIGESTEAPIDEPTEAPIDEPTEAPIGESTEAPIGESTEAPIGESTEASVEEITGTQAEFTTEDNGRTEDGTEETNAGVTDPATAPVMETTAKGAEAAVMPLTVLAVTIGATVFLQ